MPSRYDKNNPASIVNLYSDFWDEMEAQGFSEVDRDFVMGATNFRPSNSVRASKKFANPEAWQMAIRQAEALEALELEKLTTDHGYPDCQGLSWKEAHQVRLNFLGEKYPRANWALLLTGQFEREHRLPREPKVAPITIQFIEHKQKFVLAQTRQIAELEVYGGNPDFLAKMKDRNAQRSEHLEELGIDPQTLLEENKDFWSPVELIPENVLLVRERLAEAVSLLGKMEALDAQDDSGDQSFLIAYRQIAETYRQTLALPEFLQASFEDDLAEEEEPENALETEASGLTSLLTAGVSPSIASGLSPEHGEPSVQTNDDESNPTGDGERELLTAKETALYLGVGYTTMLAELNTGRFPFANRVGRTWKIDRQALRDWLAGHRDDVDLMKAQSPPVLKSQAPARAKKPPKVVVVRPDGRNLSF